MGPGLPHHLPHISTQQPCDRFLRAAVSPDSACCCALTPSPSPPHPPARPPLGVQTSGNDVFFRNPFNVEENLFVNVSSPSSSKYETVADLGAPEEAATRTEQQVCGAVALCRAAPLRKARERPQP